MELARQASRAGRHPRNRCVAGVRVASPFYRGILLLALDRAFSGRKRFLGVDWGWGAVLSCLLFGMAHAFGFSQGGFSFDPVTMALTAIPSFIAVWLRLRTGSLLLPILLHNFGNSFSLLA